MVVGGRELIDTLWNVNNGGKRAQREAEKRINRYIMECKYKRRRELRAKKRELIDTLWNVNNYGGTRDYIDTTN